MLFTDHDHLHIQTRLSPQAGLELWARLSSARPRWDIEIDDRGLSFYIPLVPGRLDPELAVLEEACARLESTRSAPELELTIRRVSAPPAGGPPSAAGPWQVLALDPQPEPPLPSPAPGRLLLPAGAPATKRFWAGASLLLDGLAEHFSPPPGAPETKGRPSLFLEAPRPVAALAAALAGSGQITVLGPDEDPRAWLEQLFQLNHQGLPRVETQTVKLLSRKKLEWRNHFGLIAVHLSPYLAARRIKTLAAWLSTEGALIVAGFAPGPQTALLLRAAARAGLILAGSISQSNWAAMKLVKVPPRAELPPLSGSVVPELVDLPPETDLAVNPGETPDPEEADDEESLILPDEEEEDEE